MSNEQSMKAIADTRTELSQLRAAAESSSEIQLIKDIERSRSSKRAQVLERFKDGDKGRFVDRFSDGDKERSAEFYKDGDKGRIAERYKDGGKGRLVERYKDGDKGRSIGPSNGDAYASGDAAEEIFRMACGLGGVMVVGMVVPMPPHPPSNNRSNGPAGPLSNAGRTEQQQSLFEKDTIQRMYAGAIAKWDTENH